MTARKGDQQPHPTLQEGSTWATYLQLLLVFFGNGENIGNVIAEPEIPERLLHMFTGDGLLGLLLTDIVCFGRDQSDKLDAALHQEVARILGEGLAGARWENLRDNLLDRCYRIR